MNAQSHFPLPVTVNKITLYWLNSALRTKAPESTLLDFEIIDEVYATCSKFHIRFDLDELATWKWMRQILTKPYASIVFSWSMAISSGSSMNPITSRNP